MKTPEEIAEILLPPTEYSRSDDPNTRVAIAEVIRTERATTDELRKENTALRLFAKKAVEALKFAHNEINNSGVVRFHEDNSWSHEDCEYKNNPESGKCDFCYGYADIKSILTDPTAKELIK